jgi:hypothetical protein
VIATRDYNVTFNAAFTLPGLDRHFPAGTYVVRVDEEPLDVSFAASRRVATTIMLTSGAMTQAWLVTPIDLEAALANAAGVAGQGHGNG